MIVGQMAVGQLAALSSHSVDNIEIRARSLNLLGKYLRLLAAKKDPMYPNTLWDKHKQVDTTNIHINMCINNIYRNNGFI